MINKTNHHKRFFDINILDLIIMLTFGMFAIILAWLFPNNHPYIYAENGLLENIQAFLLIIACLLFLLATRTKGINKKIIPLFCSLLCYSFLLRELDIESFNTYGIIRALGSGTGKNISLTIGFLSILIYAAFNDFYSYLNAAIKFAQSRSGAFLMCGGFFLIIGSFFEDRSDIIFYFYFEEMFELLGYVLIFISSLSMIFYFPSRFPRASIEQSQNKKRAT